VYALEKRRVPGREDSVTCVLLDSVQSQANRMELALQEAVDAGKIRMPIVLVDFSEHAPTGDVHADKAAGRLIDAIGKITSLQAPHRLADAILRDSELKEGASKAPFRQSSKGKALNKVSLANATPLFELCPTALIFGMWDSTGPKGGLGPKFERAIVSEVVGIGAEIDSAHRARGVRRDPLEIRAAVKVLKAADNSWKVADPKAKGATEPPSKVNHSSVPFDSANAGVTIEYAEQVTTLSLICLRRLRFPVGGDLKPERDVTARTVLAALGLCAATLAFESGMGLRSRCLLWPDGPLEWELLATPGAKVQRFVLSGDDAVALLSSSVAATEAFGLRWPMEPITLQPSAELLKLVRLSQLEATKDEEA
jgi:CRISPR-associated protein Csb1